MSTTTIQATGRRKTSTASIQFKTGTGQITINKKNITQYFPAPIDQAYITEPLRLLNKQNTCHITIRVTGGGKTGQKGAIRLGISRALLIQDSTARPTLKQQKLLTRDSRKVEPKKYGFLKARKKEPFRKR